MTDITSFMNWFLDQVIKIFTFVFNTLDSITFWGFSLLDFIIGISVIGAMLTVLFTFAPSTSKMVTMSDRDKRSKKGSDKNEK